MRVRFAKQGDLRFASHRDLLRVIERLFRRAEVAVRQSEGFHPKPRLMFPSALALGITGQDEVFEVDLLRPWQPAELLARLSAETPPGLALLAAEFVPPGSKKAQASRLCYELALPAERVAQASRAVDRVNAADSLLTQRQGREAAVDLKATLEELTVCQGVLRMTLRAIHTAHARPRDILEVLELADLEFSGSLVRSRVELAPSRLGHVEQDQSKQSNIEQDKASNETAF
jgi:radical SAM-linked protein